MPRFAIPLLSFLAFLAMPGLAQAQESQSFIDHPVRICAAEPGSDIPPDFEQADCYSKLFYQADPQNQMLWVEIIFDAQPSLMEADKPLGLFFSAKASSEAVLNGVAIGTNGKPGVSALSEEPGDMDAVFFVPEGTLVAGENRLIMRLSAMHGGITLNSPIHRIALAPYRDPRQPGPATWFALITFGLFVAAFVFFGVRSKRGNDRRETALIAAISLAAALQLAAEAARDIMPYPYPLHELRLSLILTFAVGLGLSFAAYMLLILFKPYRTLRMTALCALLAIMLLIAALQPGFDLKTGLVLIAAFLTAGLAGAIAFLKGNRQGGVLALAGFALAGAMIWLGGLFLDTVLYLVIAVWLLFSFFKHARAGDSGQAPAAEAGPESALEPAAPKRIELTSNGKVEFVDASDIVRFSGAGDYVEVFLNNGRSALHSASLAALERDLSEGFIRTHRSHIVNAKCVKSLNRESAGTGTLQMSDGSVLPVSRRNMASVRDALTHG